MKNFILGVIIGLILNIVAVAYSAKIVGGNGYLTGWDVIYNGERICSAPYLWISTR